MSNTTIKIGKTDKVRQLTTAKTAKTTSTLSNQTKTTQTDTLNIFDVPIHKDTMQQAVQWIIAKASKKQKVVAQFVNADCLNKAYKNDRYRRILQRAQHVFADGSGIKLACKIMHCESSDNVNGTDLFPALCEKSQAYGTRIFLLGARPNIAKKVKTNMERKYPGVRIVGVHNGYFDDDQTDQVIEQINQSKADVLLVAMGAPLQEIWIDEHRKKITVPVCIGVGGLFDFYSGRISRAPKWLRSLGCEWMWRLLQEPGRMWKRYLVGNFVFVFRVVKQAYWGVRHA